MRKGSRPFTKGLAEAIILQAMEDLWAEEHKKQSMVFFSGEGFRLCAELAVMGLYDQVRLLQILKGVLKPTSGLPEVYATLMKKTIPRVAANSTG